MNPTTVTSQTDFSLIDHLMKVYINLDPSVQAAILVLFGVIFTNIVTLIIYLLANRHNRHENQKDRDFTLNKKVYLDAVEAVFEYIGNVSFDKDYNLKKTNTRKDDKIFEHSFKNIYAIANKDTLIALNNFIEKIHYFQTKNIKKTFELSLIESELLRANGHLELCRENIKWVYNKFDELFHETKRNPDIWLQQHNNLNEFKSINTNAMPKIIEIISDLEKRNTLKKLEIGKSSIKSILDCQKEAMRFVFEVRKELNKNQFNEDDFTEIIDNNNENLNRIIKNFEKSIDENLNYYEKVYQPMEMPPINFDNLNQEVNDRKTKIYS